MTKLAALLLVALVAAGLGWCLAVATRAEAAPVAAKEPMVGHMVFFTLKDNSPAAKQKLVEACKKYLAKHPGTEYFSAGARAEDFQREVNDRDWDVALHLVFKDKAAHDKYQDADLHKQFIDENKDNWKKVRVFDSYVN